MLETLITATVIIAVALAGIVAFAATRPDTFRVARSARIAAPPDRIFGIICDFANWPSWSPWQKLDPAMTQTSSGPAAGVGAVSEWQGNRKVGAGRIEIIEATPPSRIVMRLDMLRPMRAHNTVEYTLEAAHGATTVTWAMHGRQPLMAKVMTVFIDCDRMVGQAFEEGLAKLKALAER